MKKHFIPGLMVCCIAAVICSQSVFAQETELEVPDVTVNSEECYEEPVDIQPGKIVELPTGEDLYKEGFVFAGWSTDPNATEGFFVYEMPNEDVTLYAVWVPADPLPEAPPAQTPAAGPEDTAETPEASEPTDSNEAEESESTEPPATAVPDEETSETDPSQAEQPDAETPPQSDEAEDSQDGTQEGQEEAEPSAVETEDAAAQGDSEDNTEAPEEAVTENTAAESTEPAPEA